MTSMCDLASMRIAEFEGALSGLLHADARDSPAAKAWRTNRSVELTILLNHYMTQVEMISSVIQRLNDGEPVTISEIEQATSFVEQL